jgi:hypothetical protein
MIEGFRSQHSAYNSSQSTRAAIFAAFWAFDAHVRPSVAPSRWQTHCACAGPICASIAASGVCGGGAVEGSGSKTMTSSGASPCIEFPINVILPPFPIERKTTMAEA